MQKKQRLHHSLPVYLQSLKTLLAYDKVLQYMAFCCHTGLSKMYELFKGQKVEKQTKTRKINIEEEEKQT